MQKRLNAFKFALTGMATFFKETLHARIHLIAALTVCLAGFYFSISQTEWLAVLLCIALVFTAEAFNSALEYLVDLATDQVHPLAKKAKDVAAAAVLMAAIFSCIIAVIIFYPYFIAK